MISHSKLSSLYLDVIVGVSKGNFSVAQGLPLTLQLCLCLAHFGGIVGSGGTKALQQLFQPLHFAFEVGNFFPGLCEDGGFSRDGRSFVMDCNRRGVRLITSSLTLSTKRWSRSTILRDWM